MYAWLLSLAIPCAAQPATRATVYKAAQVFSGQSDHVDANWFVVEDGHFVELGRGSVPERFRDARVVDLGGSFVAPGFVDAHVHFVDGGLSLLQTDAGGARSREDVAQAIARAARHPVDGWAVVRNVSLAVLSGELPNHTTMQDLAALAEGKPLLLFLMGGHHVYADRAALARLQIDASTTEPRPGTITRDARGEPTGLLIDEAAWEAVRAFGASLDAATIARAILAAQQLALRYGITAIGDNTFFPLSAAQYARLADSADLRVRVAMRSLGAEPATRQAMVSLGAGAFGRPGTRVRYFGEKFFVDAALSTAGAHGDQHQDGGARFTERELRDMMLRAGSAGTAFHTQSRTGAERLARARLSILARRSGAQPDVMDHCGRCGGGDLPVQLRDAGLRVTLLPGQLHELPGLLHDLPASEHASLLPIRELFAAHTRPALTSDWPYGPATSYPSLPDGFHRTGLAPLANIAVAVSGRDPDGRPLAGASERTITVGQALLGSTRYGAAAVGRNDLGRIAQGARADFVVLPSSPFDVDPVALYRMDPVATYIDGELMRPSSDTREAAVERVASEPLGSALAPVLGYSPTTGFLLGGAWFFYSYRGRGPQGSVQAYGSPSQLRGRAEADLIWRNAWGRLSPRMSVSADTLKGRYYGVGMETRPTRYVSIAPIRVDASLGAQVRINRSVNVGLDVKGGWLENQTKEQMAALASGKEGPIDGAFVGGRVELVRDDRDNPFSTRFGGREVLWSETYGLQGSKASPRGLFGITVTRFLTLRAPDLVLALRADAATSVGERAYATDFALGGSDLLRGYYQNRFRGQHMAAASAELRCPIFGPFSGALFGEVGRVWVNDGPNAGSVGSSGGIGLRYALPPSRLARLRLDAGFAPDQWGIFFKFNEAF